MQNAECKIVVCPSGIDLNPIGEAAKAYGISAIPVTLFIDSHGKLVYQKTGMMDAEELQSWIDTLLILILD